MADVICPQCGGRFHETTGEFRLGVVTRGNMLTIKKAYRENGWSSFYEHESVTHGGLECPECGGTYCLDGGIVRIDQAQLEAELRVDAPGAVYAEVALPSEEPEKRRPGRPKKG